MSKNKTYFLTSHELAWIKSITEWGAVTDIYDMQDLYNVVLDVMIE